MVKSSVPVATGRFCTGTEVPASQKYEKIGDSYLKRVFTLLRQYSDNPVEDQLKLWDICIFNYLIGNTDNHIKNIDYCMVRIEGQSGLSGI